MSLPANTLRTLSSSRFNRKLTSQPFTLLPFLYQTSTIQQCRRIRDPRLPRDNAETTPADDLASRVDLRDPASVPKADDIPFDTFPTQPQDLAPPRKRETTITDSERQTFEKLFRKIERDAQDQGSRQAADDRKGARARGDEDDASLESIFGSVLEGQMASGTRARSPKMDKEAGKFQGVAQTALRRELMEKEEAKKREKAEAMKEETERIHKLQEQESVRIMEQLHAAQTDIGVWNVLEKDLFTPIRELDLDGTRINASPSHKKGSKRSRRAKDSPPPAKTTTVEPEPAAQPSVSQADTLRILTSLYPTLLAHTAGLFRKNFPSSPLPLSLLPTIKSLGRGSYMLGASTALYNQLLKIFWIRYASYDSVVELLRDMDSSGISYDFATLDIVERMLEEGERAREGLFGGAVKAVWRMQGWKRGSESLEEWKEVVVRGVQREAGRRVREGDLVRRFTLGGDV